MDTATSIKKDIKQLVESMGFNFLNDPETREEEGRFFVDLFVDEPRNLIGEKGATLQALQLIARLLAAQKYRNDIRVDIDVNGYKMKRAELLRDMAHKARRRALEQVKEVGLEPMNAFDRRVIHTALAEYKDVSTESYGEGLTRYVVVRPAIQNGSF